MTKTPAAHSLSDATSGKEAKTVPYRYTLSLMMQQHCPPYFLEITSSGITRTGGIMLLDERYRCSAGEIHTENMRLYKSWRIMD
jgi:hypothetical protein